MRAMEHLQLDPLAIMARAQDLMLASRVIDYQLDDWARLTYERRKFFDWGGWLAVRPMDELPYWRNLMRREREMGHWREVEHEHHETIVEMRRVLDRMLELETYNEVVTLLRDIISDQNQINEQTKKQQKERLRSLFQD